MPGLLGNGAAIARVTLQPGAINQPHIHPRAAEMLYLVHGMLRVCFVEENGGSRFCNDLRAGEAAIFPIGTIHYQQNFGHSVVEFIAVLTSDNPGVTTLPARLFDLPSEALGASFNRPIPVINRLRNGLPANPSGQGRAGPPAATLRRALEVSGF
eukprot:Plantae.Rhodophyta-Rhodochaete_pulchella.ctg5816.p1 GENE.Plantae.Rhodophyta-Rhodochaete_pulchella.ctg5816~~Plantae.Rhodophyta-Rhodochaete_pulchella.ctg5816.p1  ORF type:complete len:178 (-),score=18.73 Plantae.Rhodophyta-Rhodochaete_pulchella.ctg5816:1033-1497(-)